MTNIIIETNHGNITLALDADKAPKTVENFLQYVNDDFFNGTIFHRVISGFMIQGGGFTPDMTQKPTRAPIENEAQNGLSNKKGTVAMARTMDPHSATAQFFINLADNDYLDFKSETRADTWGYTVFGEVTEGLDVVETIGGVKTGREAGMKDVPVEKVDIVSIKVS